jgi:hypothetical protein
MIQLLIIQLWQIEQGRLYAAALITPQVGNQFIHIPVHASIYCHPLETSPVLFVITRYVIIL